MTEKSIVKLVILHIGTGILIAFFPFTAKIYAILIALIGIYFVTKNRNQNNEVLYTIAYLAGSEALLRTTFASPCYEYGRYSMLFFTILGLFYNGIPKKINPYWLFILLILPGVFIPFENLHDIKTKITFDILGPFCLGLCALYTYRRKISKEELYTILGMLALPTLATSVFLMITAPYYDGAIINAESNTYLSGGFAPNQMATLLGLGTFACFLRIVLIQTSKKLFIINVIVFSIIYYRGLMTFSRGGMFTAFAIIAVFSVILFFSKINYIHIKRRLALMLILLPTVFILTSYQTSNYLYLRHANKNINGLPKAHEIRGREELALEEIRFFKKNPVLGMGVGTTKEVRKKKYGTLIQTHNEITRMLAEHGILGALSLIILIFFPLYLYFKNRQNIFMLSFFAFWLLTVCHSGMRVAAPAFIYALALLDIQFNKKNLIDETETN